MIRVLPHSALQGIQAGLAKASEAADAVTKGGLVGEDRVSLSGEEPTSTAEAMVDLRLASYQVAANAAVMKTYDEIQGIWTELGDAREG